MLGQPDAEPVAVVAGIVAGEGGSVKMGALGGKVKQRLFKPWGSLFRERFGAFFRVFLLLAPAPLHISFLLLPPSTPLTPPFPPIHTPGTMDQFLAQRPQYFRLDKAADTVHLRPGAFPAGALDGSDAGGEAEGAGLGGSGGKW